MLLNVVFSAHRTGGGNAWVPITNANQKKNSN